MALELNICPLCSQTEVSVYNVTFSVESKHITLIKTRSEPTSELLKEEFLVTESKNVSGAFSAIDVHMCETSL